MNLLVIEKNDGKLARLVPAEVHQEVLVTLEYLFARVRELEEENKRLKEDE